MNMRGVAFERCLFVVFGGDADSWCMTTYGVELRIGCQWILEQCQQESEIFCFHGCKDTVAALKAASHRREDG